VEILFTVSYGFGDLEDLER